AKTYTILKRGAIAANGNQPEDEERLILNNDRLDAILSATVLYRILSILNIHIPETVSTDASEMTYVASNKMIRATNQAVYL
ncbi:hypothetical protein ACJX0J_008717, partial [Zea mays]